MYRLSRFLSLFRLVFEYTARWASVELWVRHPCQSVIQQLINEITIVSCDFSRFAPFFGIITSLRRASGSPEIQQKTRVSPRKHTRSHLCGQFGLHSPFPYLRRGRILNLGGRPFLWLGGRLKWYDTKLDIRLSRIWVLHIIPNLRRVASR
jgi:hypothetical protein